MNQIPTIRSTANTPEGVLPIRDHAGLREMLTAGDIPTLLMVYVHLGGDESLLQRYSPHIKSMMQGGAAVPEALAEDLRERLFTLLTREPPLAAREPDTKAMQRMMSVAVGEPVDDEFVPLVLEQSGFTHIPGKDAVPYQKPPADFRVLIIGAGLTGINAGVRFAEAGYEYDIIERNPEVGGTWFHTRYPGLAVDTPSHYYSFSFELNGDWTHWFSRGPDNQKYLVHCAHKYGVRDRVIFNTEVVSCTWNEASEVWEVRTRAREDGREELRHYHAIMTAAGFSTRPKPYNIAGHESFRGTKMHTARWDDSVDLAGKRVAVIGTGASSMQVSPEMAKIASQLTVFQRSKHWVMPVANLNDEIPEAQARAMREIPHYAQWWRLQTYWNASDNWYNNVLIDPHWHLPDVSVNATNEQIRQYLLGYIDEQLADRPDLKDKVTPDYPPGAKRFCMDNGWFDMLKRDNVALETDGIEQIVEDGIITRDGRLIEVDVIIFATGYMHAKMLSTVEIVGRDGVSIRDVWGEEDPRAYLGLLVPGFPNLFVGSGPNSAPNHGGGVNILAESQIHYILASLDLLHQRGGTALEISETAHDNYNQQLDAKLEQMIWGHPRVNSYYQNSKGRLYLSSPWRLVDYWNMTRSPEPAHFTLR
ncbi:flavin-containing monooxygenase [Parahaliea mediterranea]|uniref:flavin-containing monooxygenase n=1 Tax=Parahaliea mediterranea TaxID=651086 RepID=UPI000E2FDD79|nr:NAD(P)/FAD-dependent oxidoreductase [Parahaliea mediterranea]